MNLGRNLLAIFCLQAKIVKRSEGRSVVAAAAYRAGVKLLDERHGKIYSYQNKAVDYSEILAPRKVPKWAKVRERLWNEVERAEKRVDSRLARDILLALPKELTDRQQLRLVRTYIKEHFVAHGMVVDLNIHRDNRENPHAHLLITLRNISREGFGKVNRSWNHREHIEVWRENWAVACNRTLRRAGRSERIDHRSHKARGLGLLPSVKHGVVRGILALERRNIVKERVALNDARAQRNGEIILANPDIALKELTIHESTFTRASLAKWLNLRTFGTEQHQACMGAVMGHMDVVQVATRNVENGIKEDVFSTGDMMQAEAGMLRLASELAEARDSHRHLSTRANAACRKAGLSDEQAKVVQHIVVNTGGLALVQGVAGAGKSRLLGAATEVWQRERRRVIGGALSGKAAQGLGDSAGIADCRSLAAWTHTWAQGKERLRFGDVFIIDEAGLVGSRQMREVLAAAHKARAKVVLVGDAEQLQAVEAGCPFRAIGDRVAAARIETIRRQEEAWQREASAHLSKGAVGPALGLYAAHQCVHQAETTPKAMANLMQAWRQTRAQHGASEQIVLAYRRSHVKALNFALRQMLVEAGELKRGLRIDVEVHRDKSPVTPNKSHEPDRDTGERYFSSGDRLCFTKNHRGLNVRNGMLGTIEAMSRRSMVVKLDDDNGRRVHVDLRKFRHFDHGYAMTVTKSQGITVPRAFVLVSRAFNRHSTYVALTRHIKRMDMFFGQDEFKTPRALVHMLSRERRKVLALDYGKTVEVGRDFAASHDPALRSRATTPPSHAEEAALDEANERLVAASAEIEKRRTVVIDAPGRQEAEARLTRARAELARVGARLIDTQKAPPVRLSAEDAFEKLEAVKLARQNLREAASARAFWRDAVEELERKHPITSKLGIAVRSKLEDPITGQSLDHYQGLRLAETRMREARSNVENVQRSTGLREDARKLVRASQVEVDKAQEFQNAYEAAEKEMKEARRAMRGYEREAGENRDCSEMQQGLNGDEQELER